MDNNQNHKVIFKYGWCELAFILLFAAISLSECKSFVEVEPPSSELNTKTVFDDPSTANGALLAIFSNIADVSNSLNYGLSLHAGLYADELTNYSSASTQVELYRNNLSSTTNSFFPLQYWREGYKNIYLINSAIEGCTKSDRLEEGFKKQLIGEAKLVRALWYFYLVNLYGDVPILTSTDYVANNTAERKPANEVWEFIKADLLEAKSSLSTNYIAADGTSITTSRIRPNSYTASALLARTYLVLGENAAAEQEANTIIQNKTLFDTVALASVFLKDSKEPIWQLSPSTSAANQSTLEARNFIIISNPTRSALSDDLLNAFELGDQRKAAWIGKYTNTAQKTFYYPNKYKVRQTALATEYSAVIRLAEIYLIRAEARLKTANLAGARADLNVIRKRAGLSDLTGGDAVELSKALIKERRIELFSEWGHRWFDIKRFGLTTEIMPAVVAKKGGSWSDYKRLWPIPKSEIDLNPKLKQNNGYEN